MSWTVDRLIHACLSYQNETKSQIGGRLLIVVGDEIVVVENSVGVAKLGDQFVVVIDVDVVTCNIAGLMFSAMKYAWGKAVINPADKIIPLKPDTTELVKLVI